MIIELAKREVFWLNAFPPTDGISDNVSQRLIVTGQPIQYDRHCRFDFGEYVQTHEEHDNSMTSRTVGALALRPTGNEQGSYFFFSLSTGRVINRLRATRLPMPSEVIDRVHLLAWRQQSNRGLVFEDRYNLEDDSDDNNDDDSSYNFVDREITIAFRRSCQPHQQNQSITTVVDISLHQYILSS
jgi:hypothetical protein